MKRCLSSILFLFVLASPVAASAQGVGNTIVTAANCAMTNGSVRGFVNEKIAAGLKAAESIPVIGPVFGFLGKSKDGEAVKDEKTRKHLEFLERKEKCWDKVAYLLAQGSLEDMTKKTLNWVNTGFNGNPLYVRDTNSYLQSIKNEQIESYLKQVQNSDPIFGNAIRSAMTQQITGRSDGRIGVTMNTPEGRAYQDFQKDFTNGGWGALLNMKNNPIGAYFNATDVLSTKIDTAQQNVKDELAQGDGFLSMKKCVEYGVQTGAAASSNGVPVDEQLPGTASSSTTAAAQTSSRKCLRYETVTPGSLIARQVSEITNQPIAAASDIDEMNEILGKFFSKLINNLFSKGLGSLKGGMQGENPYIGGGAGSNVVIGTNGQFISSITGDGLFGYEDTDGNGIGPDFDITRPQLLRKVLKNQKDYYNKTIDSQIVMNRIVPTTGALDYCFPGPNPSWPETIEGNYDIFVSAFKTEPAAMYKTYTTNPPAILVDKVTNGPQRIGVYEFTSHLGFGSIAAYFEQPMINLIAEYNDTYSLSAITNAYVNAASSPADEIFARGYVRQAYNTTGNLINYNSTLNQYNAEYAEDQELTDTAIRELELIHNEVQQIVSVAKNRYIAQQAAAGTPVNTQCLNQAYVIDNSPVVGTARLESDVPSPIIQQTTSASTYFYNNL